MSHMSDAKAKAMTLARKEIALIHMGKAHLGLDEGTYRALIAAKANGKTSSKDLTWQERKAVLDHMTASGFTVRPKAGRPDMGRREDQMAKLRAMWHQLAAKDAVQASDDLIAVDAAILAWAKRMLGARCPAGLRFATVQQMTSLIEAMKKWCLRVGVDLEAAPTNELKVD